MSFSRASTRLSISVAVMPSSRVERRDVCVCVCVLSSCASCSNSFLIKLLANVDDLKNDFHTPTPSFPIECSLPAKDKLLRVKVAPWKCS